MPSPQPHEVVPDGDGGCAVCPLPASNRVHATAAAPAVPPLLLPVPPPVGLDAPLTSVAAAVASTPRQGTKQATLIDLIARRPLGASDDEMEAITGWSHQSVSAARNALMNAGWLVALTGPDGADVTRPTRFGNQATAWTLTAAGWRAYEQWTRQ